MSTIQGISAYQQEGRGKVYVDKKAILDIKNGIAKVLTTRYLSTQPEYLEDKLNKISLCPDTQEGVCVALRILDPTNQRLVRDHIDASSRRGIFLLKENHIL